MKKLLSSILPPALVLALVLLVMEAVVRILQIPPFLLPRPSAIFAAIFQSHHRLVSALWTSSQAALIGFVASMIFGIFAAIVLSSSRWVRRAIYPYTVFFQTVPIIAIAPLLVIWFEPGLPAVAISAFIVSVFPVIASTLMGLLLTDPALVDLFKLYKGGWWARLWKLQLPWALPNIITGLRVAAGLAVIGTVVSEVLVGLIGQGEGLGVLIISANKQGRVDLLFAAVLLTSMLGLTMFAAINLAGGILLRHWNT
jgi:NitT/TauT family transport system permease protein